MMYDKHIKEPFMELPRFSVFGDYQILYKLKSNIVFKTAYANNRLSREQNTTFLMCVEKRTFLDLCELYPKTAEDLKVRALEKRQVYLKYLNQ